MNIVIKMDNKQILDLYYTWNINLSFMSKSKGESVPKLKRKRVLERVRKGARG